MTPTPADALDAAEEARRVAIYVLQLADNRIGPLLGESIVRAYAADGWVLTRTGRLCPTMVPGGIGYHGCVEFIGHKGPHR